MKLNSLWIRMISTNDIFSWFSFWSSFWTFFQVPLGQVISIFFCVLNFFQKPNKNTSRSRKNEFIRLFFGRIHGLTICFQNWLTFITSKIQFQIGGCSISESTTKLIASCTCIGLLTTKVIIEKSCGGRFSWNRNWDLGWIWASWHYWKKNIWADYD